MASGSGLQAAAAFTRPSQRLGGLTAPANAVFSTKVFAWPASGAVWLNANSSWWNHSTPGAIQPLAHCDQGCQAYILAELIDAASGATIPGYEKEKCILRNVEGSKLPLHWKQGHDEDDAESTGPAQLAALQPHVGQEVRLRLYFRAAIVYAFGTG